MPHPLRLNIAGDSFARFAKAQRVGVYNPPVPKGLVRIYGHGDWHFITCSCYRRLPFLSSPRRRDLFLKILEETRRKYQFVVAGYVVMPEHVHLLITEPKIKNPSVVMQVLKQRVSLRSRNKKRRSKTAAQAAGQRSATGILAAPISRFQRVHEKEV